MCATDETFQQEFKRAQLTGFNKATLKINFAYIYIIFTHLYFNC